MKIPFDYGKDGLKIGIEPQWKVDIITPKPQQIIKAPVTAIRHALRHPIDSLPLKELLKRIIPLNKVSIVVSDATRPVPSHFILEALITELNKNGIKNEQIIILIANGLHRPSKENELKRIIGKELLGKITVIDHKATHKFDLINLGIYDNEVPIWVNKHYVESDLRILTGYVEPHFFAGFSGGRKSIIPGIAGEETIMHNHSAKYLASPYAKFGVCNKNPIHQNALKIAEKVGADFIVNVCIDKHHRITKVAAGDLVSAHKALIDYQLQVAFKKIPELYDIVICGNGGYPLDLNLYQAVKSMAIGGMCVKTNGTIISVNECSDGIGEGQDQFKKLLFSKYNPSEMVQKLINMEISVKEQWQIQILARILIKSEIYVVSTLKKEELGTIGLKWANSVEDALENALKTYGNNARILILPNGPQIIPSLRETST